jgi:hypothetical protein
VFFDSFAPLTQVRDRIVDSKGDVVGVCGLAALKELRKQVKPYQLGRVFFLRRGLGVFTPGVAAFYTSKELGHRLIR